MDGDTEPTLLPQGCTGLASKVMVGLVMVSNEHLSN